MSVQRTRHTATLLCSGKVLITGGYGQGAHVVSEPGQILTSAEIYDPIAGTLTVAANVMEARAGRSATLLPDDNVLLAGGYNSAGALASAELYDPSSGSFSLTGNMVIPRAGHAAVLLSSGMVLIAGGEYLNAILPHAELFDPASGKFSNTGSLQAPRILHPLCVFIRCIKRPFADQWRPLTAEAPIAGWPQTRFRDRDADRGPRARRFSGRLRRRLATIASELTSRPEGAELCALCALATFQRGRIWLRRQLEQRVSTGTVSSRFC